MDAIALPSPAEQAPEPQSPPTPQAQTPQPEAPQAETPQPEGGNPEASDPAPADPAPAAGPPADLPAAEASGAGPRRVDVAGLAVTVEGTLLTTMHGPDASTDAAPGTVVDGPATAPTTLPAPALSAPDLSAPAAGPATPGAASPGAASPASATATRPTPGRPTPGHPTPGHPTPGHPTPGRAASGRPAAATATDSGTVAPSDTEPSDTDVAAASAFGRVADDGTVYVRIHTGERPVGTWTVGDQQQALAFFARRFLTLRTEVALAETRVRAGSLSAEAAQGTVRKLRDAVESAQAVGDLDDLALRVDALDGLIAVARERRRAERAAETSAARERKTALVAEAEQVAAGQNWRVGPEKLRALFDEWKSLPRLDRATDDDLWKRFSAARTTYTRRRKVHYSELTASRDAVKAAKDQLIGEAEALRSSTDWGPTTARHRVLMDRWKAAGSAAKDVDDALWERFRAARQAFFEAREAHDAERSQTEETNLAARQALLAEAEALLPVRDLTGARRAMRGIRERWDATGHIPRSAVATVDARLRTVEEALRGAEHHEWRRTDPEARRRAERTAEQLRPSITRLERDAAAARDRDDTRALREAEEALTARRQWLVQAEKIIAEA